MNRRLALRALLGLLFAALAVLGAVAVWGGLEATTALLVLGLTASLAFGFSQPRTRH